MARPKGSKSINRSGYAGRTKRMRKKYGKDCYHKWGKLGGNPILIEHGRRKK